MSNNWFATSSRPRHLHVFRYDTEMGRTSDLPICSTAPYPLCHHTLCSRTILPKRIPLMDLLTQNSQLITRNKHCITIKYPYITVQHHAMYIYVYIYTYIYIYIYIHLVVCLTTGPKPLPKRALHIVRSRASSFK